MIAWATFPVQFPSCVQLLWMSSIYLEAVAILPQLTLLMRTENIDNLTGNYVFLLGAYRALYILNWIYRYFTETHYQHWLGAIPRVLIHNSPISCQSCSG